MATVVLHTESGQRYLLVGSGYGAYRTSHPSMFLGALAPKTTGGALPVVLCVDETGELHWFRSEGLRVESVDGVTPAQALGGGSSS